MLSLFTHIWPVPGRMTPLARKGIKVFGVGMEADSTSGHWPLFRRSSMTTTCSKCASLMVSESSAHHHSTDYTLDLGDVQTMHSCAYRCLTCGNFEDAVVLANRAKQADERRLVEHAETIATWASISVAA